MTVPTIELVELEPVPVVVLPSRVVRSESLVEEIARAIARVESAVTAAQVPVAGAPFVRYLTMGSPVEIEVGAPLTGSHAVPSLRAGLLPGGPAVTTWHVGSGSGLAGAFADLAEWIGRHAEARSAPWESYWTPPAADPARVQVVWPVELP